MLRDCVVGVFVEELQSGVEISEGEGDVVAQVVGGSGEETTQFPSLQGLGVISVESREEIFGHNLNLLLELH